MAGQFHAGGHLKAPRLADQSDEFEAAIRLLAEASTTTETPGVARDELADTIIIAARQWVTREDRSRSFVAQLD